MGLKGNSNERKYLPSYSMGPEILPYPQEIQPVLVFYGPGRSFGPTE